MNVIPAAVDRDKITPTADTWRQPEASFKIPKKTPRSAIKAKMIAKKSIKHPI